MVNAQSRILVLSSHTDDLELCMGATVARWIGEGCHVQSLVLSRCDESTPEGFKVGELVWESRAAHQVLSGVPVSKENKPFIPVIGPFPVRYFPQHRQAILEYLYAYNAERGPFDLVCCPSSTDKHQDHRTVYEEAVRIFKHTTMWGYVAPWNILADASTLYVVIEEEHLMKKQDALACYKSQSSRRYFDRAYIRALARATGGRVGADFAESFELIRMVL